MINRLGDNVTKLSHIQEKTFNQQSEIQQRKELGMHRVHYTTSNMILRASTSDGEEAEERLTTMAQEILGCTKKEHALNIFLLGMNDRGIRCHVTPAFVDAICSGCLISKQPFEPSPFSIYNCASSFQGTRLDDLDLVAIFEKDRSGRDLSTKEREALEKETITVATSISALEKQIKIFHAALQVFIGPNALITHFLQEWKSFIEESDDRLADLQRRMDPDLAAKMQFFIAQVCNDWFESARFALPDEGSLGWTQVKRSILQNNHSLSLPPLITTILHPIAPPNGKDRNRGGDIPKDDGRSNDRRDRGAVVQHDNQERQLKCSRKFYQQVIYPFVIKDTKVSVPRFSNDCAECLNFAFCGICHDKCERKKAHKTARGDRKKNLIQAKQDCIAAYKSRNGSEPDF